jgi:hypothetical protein
MFPSTLVMAHLSPAFDPGVMVPEAKTIPENSRIRQNDFVMSFILSQAS